MEENELNPTESLRIINTMIDTAKNKIADDGFHIIFWGWLITFCALTHYVFMKFDCNWGFWVWMVFPPLGGIFSTIYGYKESKTKKVKTYIDSYLGYLWSAFLIGLLLLLVFMPWHGVKYTYFGLMILYGIATYVTGGLLSFKPLIIGSFFSFAFAIVSVFVDVNEQLLCISGALICSYIIPGHLLRSKFKSQHV